MWPPTTTERNPEPLASRNQVSIAMDTEFHGVGTEFHRARHRRVRLKFAGTGFAGSCVSVRHRAHNVMQVTIDWPVTVTAVLALPFSSVAVRPRPLANSVVNLLIQG